MTIDAHEVGLIRASLRHVLTTCAPTDVPGALLAEGWAELIDADVALAITVLAEEAGRARSAAPVVDLAMPAGAGFEPDATTVFVIDELVVGGFTRASRFVLVKDSGLFSIAADDVTVTPINGVDPSMGLGRVQINVARGDQIADGSVAARTVTAGRLALASQMVGAVEQMLTDTIGYVNERHQYGRAIGSFQSVKHRLADVKVAVAAAKAGVHAAWEAGDTTSAIAAKCLAGRAQLLASTHCFQVHGGIAFTVEHGFHQWVRRGQVLDLLLGSTDDLTRQLGQRLIATGSAPRVPANFSGPTNFQKRS